jgi:hypothetical protein
MAPESLVQHLPRKTNIVLAFYLFLVPKEVFSHCAAQSFKATMVEFISLCTLHFAFCSIRSL